MTGNSREVTIYNFTTYYITESDYNFTVIFILERTINLQHCGDLNQT